MKEKRKKTLKWAIPVVIILAAAVVWLLQPDTDVAYSQTQAMIGNIQTTYSFTGNIVAPRSQTVTASAGGKVKEVYVEVNQMVEEGDRLLKLASGEVVRAEIDGEVAQLNVQEDDLITAGSTMLVVMDTDRLEAEVLVDEYDVGAVEAGREVTVTVNALGETCEGRVKSLDKQATVKGSMAAYVAHIELDVPEKALPGMEIEAVMLDQSVENALLLEIDALQFDTQNQAYVLTKNATGELTATYVETGVNDGTRVQIVSGLQNGQTVYYAASIDVFELMKSVRGGR